MEENHLLAFGKIKGFYKYSNMVESPDFFAEMYGLLK